MGAPKRGTRGFAELDLPKAFTRLILMIAVVLAALAGGSRALAQVPSVLEEVKLVTADESSASFLLRFSPQEPQYSVINTNPTRPDLLMRATVRAPRIPQRGTGRSGIVRGTRFEVTDSGLLLHFETGAPAEVRAQPAGDRAIQVTITRLSGAEATGVRPIGSTAEEVVPATNLPAYDPAYAEGMLGDAYELVPLKYADVSEVIGLLVEGEQIQPNNIFIRREPGFGSIATSSTQPNYVSAQNQAQQGSVPLGQSFPGRGLAIDRRLNAIWITGTPERIERIKQQIALIDIPVD